MKIDYTRPSKAPPFSSFAEPNWHKPGSLKDMKRRLEMCPDFLYNDTTKVVWDDPAFSRIRSILARRTRGDDTNPRYNFQTGIPQDPTTDHIFASHDKLCDNLPHLEHDGISDAVLDIDTVSGKPEEVEPHSNELAAPDYITNPPVFGQHLGPETMEINAIFQGCYREYFGELQINKLTSKNLTPQSEIDAKLKAWRDDPKRDKPPIDKPKILDSGCNVFATGDEDDVICYTGRESMTTCVGSTRPCRQAWLDLGLGFPVLGVVVKDSPRLIPELLFKQVADFVSFYDNGELHYNSQDKKSGAHVPVYMKNGLFHLDGKYRFTGISPNTMTTILKYGPTHVNYLCSDYVWNGTNHDEYIRQIVGNSGDPTKSNCPSELALVHNPHIDINEIFRNALQKQRNNETVASPSTPSQIEFAHVRLDS